MNKYYRLECPRCKSKMNEWELKSLPPQYECECSECRTKLNFTTEKTRLRLLLSMN